MLDIPKHMVIILACSKDKAPDAFCKAGDLYRGSIYTKGKDIATKLGIPFFILSAKYGFLNPGTVIENYNVKFKKAFPGPFPPEPWHGFYLGGALYFQNAPKRFEPLVPPSAMGFMLQNLKRLQDSPERAIALAQDHISRYPE